MQKAFTVFTVFLLLLVATMTLSSVASAQFASGNLVVVQMGDGSAALSGAATPVSLLQYSTAGALIKTIPITSTGVSPRLIVTGNSGSEGHVVRSFDGRYVTIVGYDTIAGTAATTFAVAAVKRVIGRINASGVIDLTTEMTDGSTGAVRSAVSDSGNRVWVANASVGIRYSSFGTIGTSVQMSSTPTNTRVVKIFNGQLYITTASGAFLSICSIGSGTPTTTGQTTTVLSGMPTSGTHSPYSFSISPDTNTAYIADDGTAANGGGIQKWTRSGGTWSLAYTLLNNGTVDSTVRGLTVDWSGANPIVYATTGKSSANTLIKVVDAGSSSTATTLVVAPTNTVFRGVDFAPTGYTTPTIFLTGSSMDFGNISVGSSSTEKTFTISAINLTDTLVVVAPQSYGVTTTSGSGYAQKVKLVPVNGNVGITTIYAKFTPTAAATFAGSVVDSSAGAVSQQLSVTGVGVQAGFSASKTTSSFGNVFKDSTKTDTITVSNASTALNLIIDSIKVRSTNTYFSITPTKDTIAASSSKKYVISFIPGAKGTGFTAKIVFYHTAASHQDTISVSGNGILKEALFSATPPAMDFHVVLIGQAKMDSITIKNIGYDSLRISNVTSSSGLFTVTPTTARLDTNKSQKFYVTYTPTAASLNVALLLFTSNVSEVNDTVKVTGSGSNVVTIAEARKDVNNDFIADHSVTKDTLFITGVVTTPNMGNSASQMSYFIQDATAGIDVFQYGLSTYTLAIGDSIRAKGVVYQYRGLAEFEPVVWDNNWITILKHSVTVTPRKITAHQLNTNGEAYEGQLVEIDTLYKRAADTWPTGTASNVSIYLYNPNKADTVQLFLDADAAISITEPSYPINVVAVVSQYTSATPPNSGYELSPRSNSDITHTAGVGVDKLPQGIPTTFELSQNYPNPFNPTTNIQFGLPSRSNVTIKVYSLLGQEIATLVNGMQEAGYHQTVWNASKIASGMYFLRITAHSEVGNASYVQVKKMILMK